MSGVAFLMIHRITFVSVFAALILSGCIAIVPVVDYSVSAPAGEVRTATHCMGNQTYSHKIDGVSFYAQIRRVGADGAPSLHLIFNLPESQSMRLPDANVSVRSLDGERVSLKRVGRWSRELFRVKGRQLIPEEAEGFDGDRQIVGGSTNDVGAFRPHASSKTFRTQLLLDGLPSEGFVVELPSLEINGKPANLPPITFRRRFRMEFMVPINC